MNYDIDFTGKRVLVVGGSSGIGNATAQAFRSKGAEVHVWGTRADEGEYGDGDQSDFTGLTYQQMDVSDFDAIKAYEPPFDSLDVLILCQGIVLFNRQEFEMDGFQQVIDVNLNSLMACTTKFRSMLEAAAGSIVIVSSAAAYHATIGTPAYSASKAGALGLARTLAQVLAPAGVRVNSIAPGYVPTKMTTIVTQNEGRSKAALASIPLGRFGTPEEMAGTALFLASPLAGYVTGQTVIADGGMIL
ncbi:MAG: SDR family NAD(P)-dependent oxidoreductase [Pikeienuella sp.]